MPEYGENSYTYNPVTIDQNAGKGRSSFWQDISGLVPVLGSIASGFIARGQAKRDLRRQQEYNHPSAVKARLAEANIPMSAMFNGGFSQQSEMPRATNLDPSLGAAKGIEAMFQNRIQKMQIQMMQKQLQLLNKELPIKDAELRKTDADADFRRADANLRMQDTSYYSQEDPNAPGKTNRVTYLESQKQQQLAKEWISRNQAALSGWQNEIFSTLKEAGVQVSLERGRLEIQDSQLKSMEVDRALKSSQMDKIANDIAHSLANQKLLGQQYTINEARVLVNNMIRSALVSGEPLDMVWLGIATKLMNPKQ